MTWQNRVKPAAYQSPSGDRFEFDYEDVSRTTEKRTAAFSFPRIDDNYIQDNGYGSRQYALRCIFWGDDCDRLATGFEGALLEPGVGKLEHPLYGTFNVVPFGRIQRRDGLTSAANQSVVDVTFWTTTGVVYPSAQKAPKNEVYAAIESYKTAQSQSYGDSMEVAAVQAQQSVRAVVDEQVKVADKYLSSIANATEAATREFRAWQQTINTGINVLVGNPVLLAGQMVNMLLAPARAVIGIQNRLVAYVDFLRVTFSAKTFQQAVPTNRRQQVDVANEFRTLDMNSQAALVAMALSAVESSYRTKPEALSVAEALLDQLATVAAWREAGYASLASDDFGARVNALDDGIAWQEATKVISTCVGYLVLVAFTLAPERVYVTDRPRTVIDLASELYGDVDDSVEFLIASNNLTGAEILEVPRYTELLWYPT